MRLHRFYIGPVALADEISIKEERLIHQWRHVFRYNVGSEIIVFDGSGKECDCVFKQLGNREAVLEVVSKRAGVVPKNPSTGSGQEITLYQSVIKKDKMEWVVEKATELGVSRIVPIISERSEKKGFNLERAQKIAIEAAEQCGRADVPEIAEIMNFESGIMNYAGKAIIFDASGSPIHNSHFINHDSFSVFIGPEGGWSEKEIERFKELGVKIFSLGQLTLRAETAAIVALTKLTP